MKKLGHIETTTSFLKLRRKIILFLLDTFLMCLAGAMALFVRFGTNLNEIKKFYSGVVALIVFTAVANLLNGSYKIVWRHATSRDLIILLRGLFFGYASTLIALHYLHFARLPRSVGMLTFLGSAFLLVTARLFYQFVHFNRGSGTKRIAIVGAGETGVSLSAQLRRSGYGKVLAFVDDDPSKIGRTIGGIKVFGPVEKVMDVVENLGVQELIIALPSATSEQMHRILSSIDTTKVQVKTVPPIDKILGEGVSVKDLRDLSLQDILGREPVKVNLNEICGYISGKCILVTGAGGSIGGEIARQISGFSPARVILLGRGENSIYEIYNELREEFPNVRFEPFIGDVADQQLMEVVFQKFRPDIVFHAAAHKHVFLMQTNLYEAVRVNVLGTINVAKLSCKYGVDRFVFISTDKAVNPTSYMGASKRLAELYILAIPRTCDTKFAIVRFGNVIGSRGSVFWKFKKQIENGGPVTVTDPRMKRYWMSIPEAVALVIQAGAFSSGRDLYVLDMGEQIPVEKIAKTLARLMGRPEIEIKYIGPVPGEKFEEELLYDYEQPQPTSHPKIMTVKYENSILSDQEIESLVVEVLRRCLNGEEKEAWELLKKAISV